MPAPTTRYLLFAVLVAAGGPTAVAAPVPKVETKKGPTTKEEFAELAKQGPKPPWMPFGGDHKRVKNEYVRGAVADVGDDFVEVVPPGQTDAVKYTAHALLQTGAVCHWEYDARCYLLADVKKGDEVLLSVGTVDKGKGPECFYLSIHKRPGGTVPESRKPSAVRPYHLERQAEVDYYENGGPLPPHMRPKFPDPKPPAATPPAEKK